MHEDILLSNERIDQLYSSKIKIIQSSEVFSFSIDAILLADFADSLKKKNSKIVDLCAGNGAVGLFLSQKVNGKIIQVEIQKRLADMARRSILLNNLEDKITILNEDLNNLQGLISKDSVDMVVCNPPYFANLETSKKNPNQYYAIARHEIKVTLEQVIEVTSGLLKFGGKANFVYRPDRLLEMLALMRKHNIAPKKIQLVYPKKDKEANIVLVQGIKAGKDGGIRYLPPIIVSEDNGKYTNVIEELLYGKGK